MAMSASSTSARRARTQFRRRQCRGRAREDDVEARRGAAEGRFRRRAQSGCAVGVDAPEKEQAQDSHHNTKQRRAPVTPRAQPRRGQVRSVVSRWNAYTSANW